MRNSVLRHLLVLVLLLPIVDCLAQIKPAVGIRQNTPEVHAFINARVVVSPGTVLEKGRVIIRDGIIVAVGKDVGIPSDARVWDLAGLTIYPGLIDSYSDYGMPKKPQPGPGREQPSPPKPPESHGAKHWDPLVLASQAAEDLFSPDDKAAEKLRAMGLTTALVIPQTGIFRGSASVVGLAEGTPNQTLVKTHVLQGVSLETSNSDTYPNSLMGTIALIRQTFLDARWYKSAIEAAARAPEEPRPEMEDDLAALESAASGKEPVVFETSDEMNLLRAERIVKEFSLHGMVRGSGYEYRRLDAVKSAGLPILLPVNFPDPPAVQTPEEALGVSLEDLRYWDEAPENPERLHEAGVPFAFTTALLKDPSSFLGNVRKAVERGLPEQAALAALTTTPAKFFGLEKKLGTLEAGGIANLVITDGDIFKEKTRILETWVAGNRYRVKPRPDFDPRGTWRATLTGAPVDTMAIVLKGDVETLQGSIRTRGKETKLSMASYTDLHLALSFTGDSIGLKGTLRMTADVVEGSLRGSGELADGKSFLWTASRTVPFTPEPDTAKPKPPEMSSFPPVYPPGAFGRPALPAQPDHVFVRGATIWTSGPQGTLNDADLLVERGKIVKVGRHLAAPADAVIIDGAGKQVTAGLIDCHSHSAVAGSVNETGKAITAEVRIGDVIDPDDIAIYRELAGGLTVANVLHGSANPIGGQNQVIKLRWGALAEQMKFEGAMPGIKFALGENPKQSNWGDRYTSRYPQTREGVEQIIRDEFKAALDYERSWSDYRSGKKKIPPRRDLQAEAIVEVLNHQRLVHAHSYRQDEIEMLMRVAESFGFRVGTFQHVLEGYKIADQIAKHGAGASTFSDWWAYKFEVYDAIPYNGALMHDQGVVVSYNSDSDEQARRLNSEAAKAVKYGGVSPEEALKFVTINPAIQLHIDKRVGSVEPGKDADFTIWSGDPLSAYSICEQTWIDGRRYFDREEDRLMAAEADKERAILIQKALGAKKAGPPAHTPSSGGGVGYSCKDEFVGREDR